MASQALISDRPASAILAIYGTPSETNDRIAQVEVRPGRREGDHLGLMLRRWGNGHWCRRDGQPAFYSDRTTAERDANQWIETGRA